MKKLLMIAAGAVAVSTLVAQTSKVQNAQQKLRYAQMAISQLYVDSVDDDKLVEEAIKGMLESLDPHSAYSDPAETRELNEPLEGNFSGIGITYNLLSDTVYVIQTISGGPSDKVGILPGDRIIAANDTVIAGKKMTTSQVSKHLRGPKGSEVILTTLRNGGSSVPDTIQFHVTRDDIPIYSVEAAFMVSPETGYISVNKFAAETANEFRDAVRKLKKQGMKNLILDLTSNTGGYLQSAVDMLGELLPENSLTVYTEGLNSKRRDFKSRPAGSQPLFADGRLVVMTNQYSASAAEITAGAIQDWDRGVIVGRRTYGKGLVQRPIPFPDGSMIRLTTAHYYTPSGRDIQKPYEKGDADKYRDDINERFNHGELMHQDSIHYDENLRAQTLNRRRAVYGGGGISPDRFVPLDTMAVSKYYRELTAKSLINKYAVSYVDSHRKEIKKLYKNDDSFVKNFNVTDAMLSDLVAMGVKAGVDYDQEGFERAVPLMKMVIKGLIGRDVYENQTYSKVYNQYDDIFQAALAIIESKEYETLLKGDK